MDLIDVSNHKSRPTKYICAYCKNDYGHDEGLIINLVSGQEIFGSIGDPTVEQDSTRILIEKLIKLCKVILKLQKSNMN